jgi:hypothetical protein
MRRQRQTKDEWENTVAAQQVSGLKASEYCAKHNIYIQTFYARRSETDVKQTVIDNFDLAVAQSKRALIFKMYCR